MRTTDNKMLPPLFASLTPVNHGPVGVEPARAVLMACGAGRFHGFRRGRAGNTETLGVIAPAVDGPSSQSGEVAQLSRWE